MKRTLLIISIALLIGFFSRGGWEYLTTEAPAAAPSVNSRATAPQAITSADTPAPSAQETTPDPAPYPATGPRVITDLETPVQEGETVITQGYYEPHRGIFIFHTFTPTLETDATGQTVIHVQAENFNIGLNGDYQSSKLPDIILTPNQIRQSTVITEGTTHELAIGAKVDPTTAMILLTANASSEPNNIGAPAAEE